MYPRILATGAMLMWLAGCSQITTVPDEATTSYSPADAAIGSPVSASRNFITGYTQRVPTEPRGWRQPSADGQKGGGT